MTNRIIFSIDTDAPYNSEETDALLESLVSFMAEEDEDVIGGSEEISIIDVNDANKTVSEKVTEILESAGLEVTVTLRSDEGVILKKLQASEIDSE